MKAAIHPNYIDTQVVCSCGTTFVTRSLKPTITIDVCSKCHPYFTGEHRFIDVKGRVDTFKKKQEFAASMKDKLAAKKLKKHGGAATGDQKSLRELLQNA
jgi:large subunit ribosomal protein L31